MGETRKVTLRELDALVAEAFGWRAWLEKRGEYELAVAQRPGDKEPWKNCRPEHQTPERYREVTCVEAQRVGFFGVGFPRFLSSIAAAWEVVERMAQDGYTMNLQWKGAGREYEHTAEVSFHRVFATDGHGVGTAPLAICLAALRAKGISVEVASEDAGTPEERG